VSEQKCQRFYARDFGNEYASVSATGCASASDENDGVEMLIVV
jgi:hypothetical protein